LKQNSIYEMRQDSVLKIVGTNHLNGVLFTSLENICYLCGFTGSDGAFVLTPNGSYFLCDSRYWTQADQEVKGCQIVHYKKKLDGIASLLLDLKVRKIGFESASLTFSLHHSLLGKLAQEAELRPLEAEIKYLRAIKDEVEMALTRTAIDLSSKAFLHIIEMLEEGVVENDPLSPMEGRVRNELRKEISFSSILVQISEAIIPIKRGH
jgi:Xaa-Pro aminopeptidase